MTHSSSGQQVQPLGAGGQAGDEGDGKTSSFVQYFYLKCTDFVLRSLLCSQVGPVEW
jgi:hypothetical protein